MSDLIPEEQPGRVIGKSTLFGQPTILSISNIDPDTWAALDDAVDDFEDSVDATGRGLRDPSPETLADWAKYGKFAHPDDAAAIDAAESAKKRELNKRYSLAAVGIVPKPRQE
jgi:hypothetical protein